MIRRTFAWALAIAGLLVFVMAVKMRSTMNIENAGAVCGIGIAFVAFAIIVGLGFPDTRGRGL